MQSCGVLRCEFNVAGMASTALLVCDVGLIDELVCIQRFLYEKYEQYMLLFNTARALQFSGLHTVFNSTFAAHALVDGQALTSSRTTDSVS